MESVGFNDRDFAMIKEWLEWCYGNASTRKRLNTEMPQKKAETPQKPIFLRRFRNFCKKNGNPSKPSF